MEQAKPQAKGSRQCVFFSKNGSNGCRCTGKDIAPGNMVQLTCNACQGGGFVMDCTTGQTVTCAYCKGESNVQHSFDITMCMGHVEYFNRDTRYMTKVWYSPEWQQLTWTCQGCFQCNEAPRTEAPHRFADSAACWQCGLQQQLQWPKDECILAQMWLAHPSWFKAAEEYIKQEFQQWGPEWCLTNEHFHRVVEMLFKLDKFKDSDVRAMVEVEMLPLAQKLAKKQFGCRVVNAALTFSQSETVQVMRSSLLNKKFIAEGWKHPFARHTLQVALETGTVEEWLAHRNAITLDFVNDAFGSYGISALIQNKKEGSEEERRALIKDVLEMRDLEYNDVYQKLLKLPEKTQEQRNAKNEAIRKQLPAYYAFKAAEHFWKEACESHEEQQIPQQNVAPEPEVKSQAVSEEPEQKSSQVKPIQKLPEQDDWLMPAPGARWADMSDDEEDGCARAGGHLQ